MQTGPLVSVIATCYNHERYVEECLESIRNQTYENVQLIIVDDCSTDRSVKVIRSWLARTGTPATLITHRVNRGICRSRNDAHRRARGRYLSMIATDDTWVPDKLAIQVPMMESLPADVAVLYGDATTMDENSATRPEMVIDLYGYLDSFPDGWVFDDLLRGNFVTSLTALVRRRCIDAVGGYDEALIYEDWDLWLSTQPSLPVRLRSAGLRAVPHTREFPRPRAARRAPARVLRVQPAHRPQERRRERGVGRAPALPDERAGLRARGSSSTPGSCVSSTGSTGGRRGGLPGVAPAWARWAESGPGFSRPSVSPGVPRSV